MKVQICLVVLIVQLAGCPLAISADTSSSEEGQEDSSKHQASWLHWWSYDGISGPDYWNINKRWRLCGSGRKQSPIELRTDRLVFDHLLEPIHLSWLSADAKLTEEGNVIGAQSDQVQRPIKVQLLNSGRGLEVWLEPGPDQWTRSAPSGQDELILARGPLSYAYRLYKIELHSSSGYASNKLISDPSDSKTSVHSSEHLINGRAFDGELQLHFYNKHLASSASEALQLASGEEDSRANLFAAIGVFLTSARKGERVQSSADILFDNLVAVPNQGNSLELQLNRSQLEKFVPDLKSYVTYQGSLNRPPCTESVDWIVVNKALRIESEKFQALFERLNTNQDNTRPVKPLNGRLLRTTINILEPKRSFRGESCMNDKNCTSGQDLQDLEGKQQMRQSSCSMRPNYAYQLNDITFRNGAKLTTMK